MKIVWLLIACQSIEVNGFEAGPTRKKKTLFSVRRHCIDPKDPVRIEARVEYGPGIIKIDDLLYLRDETDPKTQSQMESEARFAFAQLSQQSELETELGKEIAVIAKASQIVTAWQKYGEIEWRARGTDDYPIWEARRSDKPEEIYQVLDENAAPCSLPSEFMPGVRYDALVRGVSCCLPSPSGQLLAYTVDATGEEKYILQFIGFCPDDTRPKKLNSAFQSVEIDAEIRWGRDETEIYVLRADSTCRPFELWRLEENGGQSLIYREEDQRFRLEPPLPGGIFLSQSRNATEILCISATQKQAKVLVEREAGKPITTADGDSLNFVYLRENALYFNTSNTFHRINDAFSLHAVSLHYTGICLVSGLGTDGRAAVWLSSSLVSNDTHEFTRLEIEGFSEIEMLREGQAEPLFEVSSPIRFPQIAQFDSKTMSLHLVARRELTEIEAGLREERCFIDDIPVVLTLPKKDAVESILLRAYGAYGACHPRHLEPATAALTARGLGIAVAGVRGGGELGPAWREQGRGAVNKNNSAIDVEKVARGLLYKKQYSQVFAWGRSAGGLSIAGAVHRDPGLFSAILLDVPFLDALGTLADETLPLTANEWEEFGNPKHNYHEISAYSPASQVNIGAKYPPMLLRPALKDARTGFWESFKFAARVRSAADAPNIIVAADDRGHFPPSSINGAAHDVAKGLAFLLSHLETKKNVQVRDPKKYTLTEVHTSDTLLDAAAHLRTTIFSSHLQSQGSIYLQDRAYRNDLIQAASAPVALDAHNQLLAVASAHTLLTSHTSAWYISSVAVRQNARRQGIAAALMSYLLSDAAKHNIATVYLHVAKENTPALKLYTKLGFHTVNTNPTSSSSLSPHFAPLLIEELNTHVPANDTSQQLMSLDIIV